MSGRARKKGAGQVYKFGIYQPSVTLAANFQLQCWRYTSCEAPFIGVSSEFLRNKERSSAASSVPPLQSNQRVLAGYKAHPADGARK